MALSLAGQQFPSLSDSMEIAMMRVPRTTCAPGLSLHYYMQTLHLPVMRAGLSGGVSGEACASRKTCGGCGPAVLMVIAL